LIKYTNYSSPHSLVGTGHVDKGAIFSAAGDSVWATSAGFTVKPQEMKAIVSAFGSDSGRDALWGNGVYIGGIKYVATKNEDRSIYGAKVFHPQPRQQSDSLYSREICQGKEGIVIVKTKQAILVTHYPANSPAGNAASVVEKLADYLIGLGY
jgi:profilin